MTKDAPTPKRKDAEKANKVNSITSVASKDGRKRDREAMKAARLSSRAAFMRGEESALPLRDRGPVKRFVRNYIDSRRSIGEYFLPFVAGVLFLSVIHNKVITGIAFILMYGAMLYTVISGFFMTRQIRKAVAERFPGESTKGVGMYGWLRSTQMRKMRAPAPQVQIGDDI